MRCNLQIAVFGTVVYACLSNKLAFIHSTGDISVVTTLLKSAC